MSVFHQNDELYVPFDYNMLRAAMSEYKEYKNDPIVEISIMKYVMRRAKFEYTCNRPPGAAGALIISVNYGAVFAGVYPPYGSPTCQETDCELEWSAKDMGHIIPSREHFHPHCVRTIHAERRAIYRAARFGVRTEDAVIYSVLKPCYECSKAIIASGINIIFYAGAAYDEPRTQRILENAGVIVRKLDVGLEYGQ